MIHNIWPSTNNRKVPGKLWGNFITAGDGLGMGWYGEVVEVVVEEEEEEEKME